MASLFQTRLVSDRVISIGKGCKGLSWEKPDWYSLKNWLPKYLRIFTHFLLFFSKWRGILKFHRMMKSLGIPYNLSLLNCKLFLYMNWSNLILPKQIITTLCDKTLIYNLVWLTFMLANVVIIMFTIKGYRLIDCTPLIVTIRIVKTKLDCDSRGVYNTKCTRYLSI